MTTIPAERLASVLVEVADTLVADFDVVDFLHLVTARAAELVPDSAVGLMLADHQGHLRFMGASSEKTRLLELFQLQNDEGPCLDCYRTGVGVVNVDLLDGSTPWPRFAPARGGGRFPLGARRPAAAAQPGDRRPQRVRPAPLAAAVRRTPTSCRRSPTSPPSG